MDKAELPGLGLSLLSLSLSENAPHIPETETSSTFSGPSPGWGRLPPECLQVIVEALTPDPGALASLLRVNRQLFFLVVPILYQDPFKTLRDLNNRETCHLRVCISDFPTTEEVLTDSVPVSTLSLLEAGSTVMETLTTNNSSIPSKDDIDKARLVAWESQVRRRLVTIYRNHRKREQSLLATLFATSVQELCARFPDLEWFYFPSPSSKAYQLSRNHYDSRGGALPIVDFGEYLERGIRWTFEEYFRQVKVLDLGRLSTRQSRKNVAEREDDVSKGHYKLPNHWNQIDTWEGKCGTFVRVFSPKYTPQLEPSAGYGVLDFLQRALLIKVCGNGGNVDGGIDNGGGCNTISSLRIPVHRLRTFQPRWERTSRMGQRSRTQNAAAAASVSTPAAGDSLSGPLPPTTWRRMSMPEVDGRTRPFCFTFDKLARLRRLEICNMSDNDEDWETLNCVVASLQKGSKPLTEGEHDLGRESGMIRELSVQGLGQADAIWHIRRIDTILSHLDKLEVLEIQLSPFGNSSELWSQKSTQWGQHLRSLRVIPGSFAWATISLQFLGRYKNLVELAISVSPAHAEVFQWIVDKKATHCRKQQLQKTQQQQQLVDSISMTPQSEWQSFPNDLFYNNDDCLPHLRQLSLTNRSYELCLRPANSAAQALGDQIRELVLQMSIVDRSTASILLNHPFKNLVRLAFRGSSLENFDFSSLWQCCPVLERLAMLLSHYDMARPSFDYLTTVHHLTKLPRLECLYLEGTWQLTDLQLLILVNEALMLYRVAFYRLPVITLQAFERANDILVKKSNRRFPLRPAGLFHLNSRMSNSVSKTHSRDLSYFGHDIND